jgi:hypothetical protein
MVVLTVRLGLFPWPTHRYSISGNPGFAPVYICIYMYNICMYTYINMCLYIYIYIYIWWRLYMAVLTVKLGRFSRGVYTDIPYQEIQDLRLYVSTYVCICMYIYRYVYVQTHIFVNTYVHMCICVYTYKYICTYSHIYTDTCIQTYTCIPFANE